MSNQKDFSKYHHYEVECLPDPDYPDSGRYWVRLFIGDEPTNTVIEITERGWDGRREAYSIAQAEQEKLRKEGKLYG